MSMRRTARAVGACLLLAFASYIAGGTMVDSGSGVPAVLSQVGNHRTLVASGALLMLMNSLAGAATGVLMFPVLRRSSELSAYGYLVCQSFAAMMLSIGTLFLLLLLPLGQAYTSRGGSGSQLPALAQVTQQGNHYSYEIGMIAWSIGGLVLARVLLRAGLVPGPLARLGLLGYTASLGGSALEVLGHRVGTAMSVPGGLFEVALAVLLIVRGFTAPDGVALGEDPADLDLGSTPARLVRAR